LCWPLALTYIRAVAPQEPVSFAQHARPISHGKPPRSSLSHRRRAISFAHDLNIGWSIVSGKVTLLSWSIEIQPRFIRICPSPLHSHSHLSFIFSSRQLERRPQKGEIDGREVHDTSSCVHLALASALVVVLLTVGHTYWDGSSK